MGCRLFPCSFEGKYYSWYFGLDSGSINSWDEFEKLFLQKFGYDITSEDLVMDLSSLRIKGKERVKDFNQRFSCLKNMIPTNFLHAEELFVDYYIKGFPTPIAMWVKRTHKNTLQEDFLEAILVQKDML